MTTQEQAAAAKKRALNILKSRVLVTMAHIGRVLMFNIVGNPTVIPVKDKNGTAVVGSSGSPLHKAIYNVKATSQIAQQLEQNKTLLREAIAAYDAGDIPTGDDKMQDYLNKTQISFNVILPEGAQPQFASKQAVEGQVSLVTTDKGSLITLENVYAPQAARATSQSIESFDDLLGDAPVDPSILNTTV